VDKGLARESIQTTLVDPVEKQIEILRQKGCNCDVIKRNQPDEEQIPIFYLIMKNDIY
jgi:hypothetical protein